MKDNRVDEVSERLESSPT